jgi:hypothetical protein
MVALTLPCQSVVCRIHAWIGFAIVALWAVLFLAGATMFLLRRRQAWGWFWGLLAALQVLLGLQFVAGLVVLLTGHLADSILHYAYGVVFPVIVLVVAHTVARGLDDPDDGWKVFAIASFFVFGLTLRALTTGLGLP